MAKKVSLKEVCRELDIDPRHARIKLRENAEQLNHSSKQRWCWEQDQLAPIRQLLSPEKKNG